MKNRHIINILILALFLVNNFIFSTVTKYAPPKYIENNEYIFIGTIVAYYDIYTGDVDSSRANAMLVVPKINYQMPTEVDTLALHYHIYGSTVTKEFLKIRYPIGSDIRILARSRKDENQTYSNKYFLIESGGVFGSVALDGPLPLIKHSPTAMLDCSLGFPFDEVKFNLEWGENQLSKASLNYSELIDFELHIDVLNLKKAQSIREMDYSIKRISKFMMYSKVSMKEVIKQNISNPLLRFYFILKYARK